VHHGFEEFRRGGDIVRGFIFGDQRLRSGFDVLDRNGDELKMKSGPIAAG
jgi:hypothetical protein